MVKKKPLEINTELLPNITVLGVGEYILIQFGVLIQKLGGDGREEILQVEC